MKPTIELFPKHGNAITNPDGGFSWTPPANGVEYGDVIVYHQHREGRIQKIAVRIQAIDTGDINPVNLSQAGRANETFAGR